MFHPYLGRETDPILDLAQHVVEHCRARGITLAPMESCTGGALSNALTSIPGASDVVRMGFITYSNEAKIALGVPQNTIDRYGVYSRETAEAMARAATRQHIRLFREDDVLGIGITGSFSRADPRNENSEIGEVHLGYHRPKTGLTASETLQVSPNTMSYPRKEDKELVAHLALAHMQLYL